MRYTLLPLIFVLKTLPLFSQDTPATYTDTAGIVHDIRIRVSQYLYDFTTHIDVYEESGDRKRISVAAIRQFSFTLPEGRHSRVFNYKTTLWEGKKYLLPANPGNNHLDIISLMHPTRLVYIKDGVAIVRIREPWEDDNVYRARAYADYPLLSQMALENDFDDYFGYENSLILQEYNKWIETDPLHQKDSSQVLLGIRDANKPRLPRRLFWKNFWYIHATGLIGMCYCNKRHPNPDPADMPIYNRQAMQNPDYARGYKARMMTRMQKKIVGGRVAGLFLPPCVFI